jgi:CRISPR/Cas system Type II protein with McrA/HNH and RuvC-like nuclease domain
MGMRTVEDELNVIHNYLYKMKRKDLMSSYDKLKKLIYVNLKSSNIRFLSGNDYEAPIRATPNTMLVNRERDLSEWIEDCLEIDNVRSALELLDRAKAKCLEGGSPEVKESPLSSLSFMEKALKRSSRITETGAIRLSRKQRRKSIVKVDRNLNKVSVPQELDCEPKISFRPKFGFAFAGPKLPV